MNLLVNAIDAIQEKGEENGKIIIKTAISSKKDNILIEIIDNGNGIHQEYIDRITEPFFTTKPSGKGTGLGMAICSEIVNIHEGTLSITSSENLGTNIKLTLPIL